MRGKGVFKAWNRWLETLEEMRKLGFVGVMMPGEPGTEFDYDDPRFDPLWEAATDLDMPLSFHILTSRSSGLDATRGPKVNK